MEIKNIKQKARYLIDKLPEILHGMIWCMRFMWDRQLKRD